MAQAEVARSPAKEAYDEARRKLTNPMPNADPEMPTESGDPEKEIRQAADGGAPTADQEEGVDTNKGEAVTEPEATAAEDDVGGDAHRGIITDSEEAIPAKFARIPLPDGHVVVRGAFEYFQGDRVRRAKTTKRVLGTTPEVWNRLRPVQRYWLYPEALWVTCLITL